MELNNNMIPAAPDNMPSVDQQTNGNPYVIDAAPGTDPSENFNFQPVSELFETPTNSDLVIDVDEDYLKMLRPVSASINKYIPPPNGNVRSPYPTYASPTYNPYSQQRGLDLTSREGRLAALKNPGATAEIFTPGGPRQPEIADPIYSSIRDTNFDRYYAHPKFNELGWQPYADNEKYYNANSSTWDDSIRMWGQFGSLFGTGYVSGYRSVGDLFDGDSYLSTADLDSAGEFSDAMRIGMSSKDGFMASVNNFTLNSAYTFGIIANIATEELALSLVAATGVGTAPAVARTGVNAVRAGRAITNFFDVGKALNATRQMIKGLGQADRARDFYNVMKSGGKFVADFILPETMTALREMNTTQNGIQNLLNVANISKGFGGFYRDLRGINLAMSESKLEAGMVYNDQFADISAKLNEKNGGTGLTPDDVAKAHDNASKASFATLWWNAPLIYASNKIVLGTALGGMNKSLGRVFDEKLTGFGKRLIRTKPLTDASGKISRDVFEDVGEGALGGWLPSMKTIKGYTVGGSFKAAAHGATRYFAANLTEGVQELAQEAIAVGTKDYYTKLFEDPAAAGHDVFKTSVSSAIDSQMNVQGFETFMSGFMMGGLVQGPQKLFMQGLPNAMQYTFQREKYNEYKQAKNDYVQTLVKTHNEAWNAMADDPSAMFDPTKLNFLVQKQVAAEMKQSAYDGDIFGFIDSKDFGKFNQMYTIFRNGTANQFRDQLEGFQSLTDEELNQAFPGFKQDIKSGKFRERIDSTLKQIDDTEKAYNDSKDKFQNPFDKKKFKVGTKEYKDEAYKELSFEHARYLYMFTQDGFKRAVERSESILSEMASEPVISKIAANDLSVLMDIDSINQEIAILGNEIAVKGETPEELKITQEKTERMMHLTAIKEVLTNSNNLNSNGVLDRRKINKLYKPFVNYVNFLAKSKNDFVNKDAVINALKKISDYNALKERAKVYDKAIEYLNNPERLTEIMNRSTQIFSEMFNNNRVMFEKNVKKHIKNLEANEFLNKLVKIGVYPNADQTLKFLETGDVNVLKEFFSEDGAVNIATDPKRMLQIAGLIKSYNEMTGKEEVEEEETSEEKEAAEPGAKQKNFEDTLDDVDIDMNSMPGVKPKPAKETVLETNDPSQSPYGKKILEEIYNKYRAEQLAIGNTYLPYKEWAKTEETQTVIAALQALKVTWARTVTKESLAKRGADVSTPERAEALIKAAIKQDIGFQQWLQSKKDEPSVRKVLDEAGLTFDALAPAAPGKNEGKDSVVKDKKNVKWHKKGPGVNILKTTSTDNEGNKTVYYQLVDNNGDALSDAILKAAGAAINGVYSKAKAAEDAQKKILDTMPDTTPFEFDGIMVRFGATVTDNNGKEFIILGTPSKVAKGGKLFLLPKEKQDLKGIKEREKASIKVQEGEFNGFYTIEDLKFSEPVDKNVSRLTVVDLLKSYPRNNRGEERAEAQKRFDIIMNAVTAEEFENDIEFVIRRNEGAGSETVPYRAGSKEPNPQIIKTTETYSIGIRISNPALEQRLNVMLEEKGFVPTDSPDGIIGFMPNNSYKLLNKEGKQISILSLDPENFDQYFGGRGTVQDIKTAYATQQLLVNAISEIIGRADFAVVKPSELKDKVTFSFQSLYKQDALSISLDQLDGYYGIEDGKGYTVDGKNVIIYDNKRVRTEKGYSYSTTVVSNLKPGKRLSDLSDKIEDELKASGKWEKATDPVAGLGRYVVVIRQPNGELTLAQLKQNKIDKEEVYGFIKELVQRAQDTVDNNIENIDDLPRNALGVITNTKDARAKNLDYNYKWNEEFNNKFYLAEMPGIDVELKVTAWGRIEISFYDKKSKQSLTAAPLKIFPELFAKALADPQELLDKIQGLLDSDPTLKKQKISVQPENFRVSFPESRDAQVIIDNTKTQLDPRVRFDYKIIVTGDSSQVQALANVSTPITPEDITAAQGPVSEDTLEHIANKLNTPGSTLSKYEQEVYNTNQSRIEKIRKDLAGKPSLDTSEDTYEGINEMSDDEFSNYADDEFMMLPLDIKNQIAAKIYASGEGSLSAREKQVMNSDTGSMINGLVSKLVSEAATMPSEVTPTTEQTPVSNKKAERIYSLKIVIASYTDDVIPEYKEERKNLISQKNLASNSDLVSTLEAKIKEYDEAIKGAEKSLELAKKDLAALEPESITQTGNETEQIKAEIESLKLQIKAREKSLEDSSSNPRESFTKLTKDPELKALKKQKNDLESKLIANKILPAAPLTPYDAETIEQFVNWATNNLPDFISIADINTLRDNLMGNGVRVGAFVLNLADVAAGVTVQGTLYTGASSSFRYHEAFHAVFRMLLTDEQIKRYLALGKKEMLAKFKAEGKSFQAEMEQFRNTAPMYREMTPERLEQEFIEEYLADKFEEFKKSPAKTETASEVKSLFQRIIEWIKSIFKRFTKNELNSLYENIDSGKFRTTAVQDNMFTNSLVKGISVEANKLIPIETYEDERGNIGYKYMDPAVADGLIANISAMYISREDKAIAASKNGLINRGEILDETMVDFMVMYNPEAEHNSTLDRSLWAPLFEKFNALKDYTEFVKQGVIERLALLDVSAEEGAYDFEQFEQEAGLRNVSDFKRGVEQIGGFESISKELRRYIGSTTITNADEFGNTELTPGESLIVPVDFNEAYNGILKAVKNTTDPTEFFTKMYFFGQTNRQTEAVVRRFFQDIGITDEQVLNDNLPASVKNPLLFQRILKGFESFRLDYIFIHTNPKDGKTYIYSAANRDDTSAQIDRWSADYDIRFQKMVNDIKIWRETKRLLARVEKYFNPAESFETLSDRRLQIISRYLSRNLYELTGIKLSAGYIEFSIASRIINKNRYQNALLRANQKSEALNYDDIKQLAIQIEAAYNDAIKNRGYTSIFSDTAGVGMPSRLRRMAFGNAPFDETVGNSVFKNPDGNLVYAHQAGTYHLKAITDLNDVEALDRLQESDPFLFNNILLNSPAFKALAAEDRLRVLRVAGSKKSALDKTDEGNYAETGGVNINDEATTYGDSSPRQFILNLINSYTYNYNHTTGKNDTVIAIDPITGEEKETAIGPSLIRVIEASNTGDMTGLPIIETITTDDNGETVLKDETVDMFYDEIKREYERIRREGKEETRTKNLLEGYNAKDGVRVDKNVDSKDDQSRAYKFTKTGTLLKEFEGTAGDKSKIKDPTMPEETAQRLVEGTQSIIIRRPKAASTIGLTRKGASGSATVTTKDKKGNDVNTGFTIINRGQVTVTEKNFKKILDSLGDAVSVDKTDTHKYKFEYKNKVGYVETADLASFLNGYESFYVFDMYKDGTKIPKSALNDIEKSDSQPIDYKSRLEKFARNSDVEDLSFEEAIARMEITVDDFKQFLNTRLIDEFREFSKTLDEIKAKKGLSKFIISGLTNEDGRTNSETARAAAQLNLTTNLEYNLMQIFFNDWLNTKALNQILLGDSAMSLKDAVDEIKRAKMQNAGGKSAAATIIAPEYGINHIFQQMSLFTFTDTEFEKIYSGANAKKGERGDAQMYLTPKGLRYILFGLGNLNEAQVKLLDKIERGDKITADEFFGTVGEDGFKDQGAVFNSLKLVYGDGKTYLKMSAVILTKEFTSRKQNGQWVAKETRKELHNMRVKMEQFEEENQTVTIAGGRSAVKMLKQNVLRDTDMFSENNLTKDNQTILDTNFMRLQLVNPSNKVVVTDPTQMKTLITSEQNDSTKVLLPGSKELVSLGDIRKKYNEAISNRSKLKFINRRNLIFNFDIDIAMDELHKSIKSGQVTANLFSFLQYATESLKASQSSSNILEFFSPENQDRYNLNNPLTITKFEQLFLRYFNNGIFSEKIPGHSVALMSDVGVKIYRRVFSVETLKDGTIVPDKFEVIREKIWESMPNKPPVVFDISDNPTLQGLEEAIKANPKEGVVIIDNLRHNLKEYNEKGEYTKTRYSEALIPAHFKDVMTHVEDSIDDPKTAEEITQEWKAWINEERWSPKAKMNIVRQQIEGFDRNRSKKEFAKAFGYTYEENEKGNVKFTAREKGKYLNNIPDAVAKMFGIRIPSQDKHSAINIKVVDFLPVFYGSTGIFPPQLIEISGADFDIDKLYIHIKQWFMENGEFVEYGSAKNDKDGYQQYINYVNQEVYKGGSAFAEAFDKYMNDQGVPKRNQLSIEDILDARDAGFNADAVDALMMLGLPVTLKQYKAYKKKNESEPYEAPYNNQVLDYKFALLGNEHAANTPGRNVPIAYEPADLRALTDVWDFIKDELPELAELVKEEGVDIDNLFGKLKAWTNNKEGANSIGAVVLPNIYLSLMKEYNISIRSEKVGKLGETIPQITLNGYTFRHFGEDPENPQITGNYEIVNGIEKKDGARRQYVISALITAMTDNAKERLAAKLGLNKDALAVVANLTALGVPIRTSILLINNPIIKEEYFNAINKEDPYDPGIKSLIKRKLDNLKEVFGPDIPLVPVTDDLLKESILNARIFDEQSQSKSFNAKILNEMKKENLYTITDASIDKSILTQFYNAHKLKTFNGNIGNIVNLVSDIGSSFENIIGRDESIRKLGLELNNEDFENLVDDDDAPVPVDVRKLFKGDTWQATYYKMYKELTEQLLPTVFLSQTKPFKNIYEKLKASFLAGDDGNFFMTPERLNKMSKDFLSYLTIKSYMQELGRSNGIRKQSLASLTNELIYPQANSDININKIISNLKAKYEAEGRTNYFLQAFAYNDPASNAKNNTGLDTVIASTFAKLSEAQKIKVQDGFIDLYGPAETRLDALHILHYIMVKDGLQFAYGTLLDAITPFILDKYLSTINNTHTVFETGVNTKAFETVFGMEHEALINDFIINYMQSNKNNYMLKTIKGTINKKNIPVYNPITNEAQITGNLTLGEVVSNPQNFYVFGENEDEEGYVGQLAVRGKNNTFGLIYKRGFARNKENYFKDKELDEFVSIFSSGIAFLKTVEKPILFPASLISKEDREYMKEKTPEIYKHIKNTLIDNFDYNIDGIEKVSGTVSKAEAAKSPMRIDKSGETEKLYIDLYNGIYPINIDADGTRISRNAVSSFKQKEMREANESYIKQAGFKTRTFIKKEGDKKEFTTEIILPPYFRIERKNQLDERTYDSYKLVKVYTSTGVDTQNLISKDPNKLHIFGNAAVYVKSQGKGSNQQNPTGFMFDTENFSRPDHFDVREFVKKKNEEEGSENIMDPDYGEIDEGNIDFSSMPGVTADENGINVNGKPVTVNEMVASAAAAITSEDTSEPDSNVESEIAGPPVKAGAISSLLDDDDEASDLFDFWTENIEDNEKAIAKLKANGIQKKNGGDPEIQEFFDARRNSAYNNDQDFLDYIKSCIL